MVLQISVWELVQNTSEGKVISQHKSNPTGHCFVVTKFGEDRWKGRGNNKVYNNNFAWSNGRCQYQGRSWLLLKKVSVISKRYCQ